MALLAVGLLAAATVEPVLGRQMQQPAFRAGTRVVSVDVAVRDGRRPVTGLAAADFAIFDNGIRQTIDSISLASVPVDVTIVVGTMNASQAAESWPAPSGCPHH